jgi:transcriptional regulator with XRE-family HTH domain
LNGPIVGTIIVIEQGVSSVSLSTLEPPEGAAGGFPHLLKTWRQKRRLSQLDLALSSGVSQRHVSFLKSGRARRSRSMILRLSESLEVPLRERNDWLTAAGFAPVFKGRTLDDPQMSQVMAAVRMMLANHAPFPAIAIDRAWNIRMSNVPFDMLSAMIGADVWARVGGAERNLMRLFFHPDGIRPFVTNWSAVSPLLWHRAKREAAALGGQEMKQVLAELSQYQDADTLWAAEDAALVPVLPFEIAKDGVRVSLFTVIATFGTAQDVTADELRIESLSPADEATDRLFRGTASG